MNVYISTPHVCRKHLFAAYFLFGIIIHCCCLFAAKIVCSFLPILPNPRKRKKTSTPILSWQQFVLRMMYQHAAVAVLFISSLGRSALAEASGKRNPASPVDASVCFSFLRNRFRAQHATFTLSLCIIVPVTFVRCSPIPLLLVQASRLVASMLSCPTTTTTAAAMALHRSM